MIYTLKMSMAGIPTNAHPFTVEAVAQVNQILQMSAVNAAASGKLVRHIFQGNAHAQLFRFLYQWIKEPVIFLFQFQYMSGRAEISFRRTGMEYDPGNSQPGSCLYGGQAHFSQVIAPFPLFQDIEKGAMCLVQGNAEIPGEFLNFIYPAVPSYLGLGETSAAGRSVHPVCKVDVHVPESCIINPFHLLADRSMSEENIDGSRDIHSDTPF